MLSHPESTGRISAEHSADICRFLLSPQEHQIKNYILGGYLASGYLVRFLARPITDICQLEAAATARPHPTAAPRQKQEEEELPPEPAIRRADIRRISMTSRMGFVNFAKHIITKIITFIEIITAL